MPAGEIQMPLPVVANPVGSAEADEQQLHIVKITFRRQQNFRNRDDVKRFLTWLGRVLEQGTVCFFPTGRFLGIYFRAKVQFWEAVLAMCDVVF